MQKQSDHSISGLSIIVHTKNAADTLEETLVSLGFADEILIIDMYSSDKTIQIAQNFTKHIHQVEDVGYADPARNFGIATAKGPWIMVVDADEVVPQSLVQKLPQLLESEAINCYYLPRKNIIFGKWIEQTGWWPDYQARLFRKGSVHWEVGVHKQPIITGKVEYLPEKAEYALVHYNYTSVEQFLRKLNTYTSITAEEHITEDRAKELAASKYTAVQLIDTFKSEFLRRLFAQNGLADHTHGVALSFLQAIYELTTKLKKWEALGNPKDHTSDQEIIAHLQDFARELKYWTADWHVKHTTGLKQLWWKCKRKWYS